MLLKRSTAGPATLLQQQLASLSHCTCNNGQHTMFMCQRQTKGRAPALQQPTCVLFEVTRHGSGADPPADWSSGCRLGQQRPPVWHPQESQPVAALVVHRAAVPAQHSPGAAESSIVQELRCGVEVLLSTSTLFCLITFNTGMAVPDSGLPLCSAVARRKRPFALATTGRRHISGEAGPTMPHAVRMTQMRSSSSNCQETYWNPVYRSESAADSPVSSASRVMTTVLQ